MADSCGKGVNVGSNMADIYARIPVAYDRRVGACCSGRLQQE